MWAWSKPKRIFWQTSKLTHLNSWSLLRIMWEIEKMISVLLSYPCKMQQKTYLQGMWELCKSERISCQTSKRTHVISWSLLRFVEKYKRWFRFQYPIHINCWKNPTCKNVRMTLIWKNILLFKRVSPWSCWDSCD